MWARPWALISTNSLRFDIQSQRMKKKFKISIHVSQALGSDLKYLAMRPSTRNLRFEVQSQRMKSNNQNFSSCEPSLRLRYQQTSWGLKFNHKEWKKKSKFQPMWAKPWAQTSRSRQRGLQQAVWGLKFNHKEWRKKDKISAYVSQALGSDLKVSATRPSTSILIFEVQLQRMKKKNQSFSSCEPSLGLWFEGLGNEIFAVWGLKFNHKDWRKNSKFQVMWVKPCALISRSRQRELHQIAWGLKFNHKEWKEKSKF
jgi:hypothetical protein